ncbi:MAG: phosphopantothenate/pantothenate synthetase [Candidatus Altiarchaeota archaeon]
MNNPPQHPRKTSLDLRHRLVDGLKQGFVAETGLIAHGRGEAYDYLLGERTCVHAERAEKAASALLLSSEKPVFSVNGNVAALCPKDVIRLSKAVKALLEVNLFYRTPLRERLIARVLEDSGAELVYGLRKRHRIPGLGSQRANVDDALWDSDTVLVMLEDGDRTGALKAMGKKVIAVDLNPLSRTARTADITIVDNVVRAVPNMIVHARSMKDMSRGRLASIAARFDNRKNLKIMEGLFRKSL